MNLRPRAAEILTRKEVTDNARTRTKRTEKVREPRVENPGKLMGRLLKYVGKNYGITSGNCGHCVFSSVCICQCPGNHVYAESDRSVYHATDRAEDSPDFGPLLGAILTGCGILC